LVTPICAPPGRAESESRIDVATRFPRADSEARSSRVPPVHTPSTNAPPEYAVVMSSETSATAVLPISAASARAWATIASTSATRGYAAIRSAAGAVVRATFSCVCESTAPEDASRESVILPIRAP
jgi:hypothetical protein